MSSKIHPINESNLQTNSKNHTENWEEHLWGSSARGVNQCNLNYYLLQCLLKGTEPAMLGENVESITWICKLFWHSLKKILGLDCSNSGIWWGGFLKQTKLWENSESEFSVVVCVLLKLELFEHKFKCCKLLFFFPVSVIILLSQKLSNKQWFRSITFYFRKIKHVFKS